MYRLGGGRWQVEGEDKMAEDLAEVGDGRWEDEANCSWVEGGLIIEDGHFGWADPNSGEGDFRDPIGDD